jgi:hypothetical protein
LQPSAATAASQSGRLENDLLRLQGADTRPLPPRAS